LGARSHKGSFEIYLENKEMVVGTIHAFASNNSLVNNNFDFNSSCRLHISFGVEVDL